MDEPIINGALSDSPIAGFDIKALSETVSRVQLQGRVSRSDVEPYLSAFPPTVSLDDFDEEPSTRGVEMAMEGFAGFLKVGLALAVVGAVGYLIWHLISSRKKGEKLGEDSVRYQALINALSDYDRFLQTSGIGNQVIQADEWKGMNLTNALTKVIEDRQTDLHRLLGNHMVHCLYDNDPCLSTAIGQFLTPEKASQKPAIDKLLTLLPNVTARISAGEEAAAIKEIEAIAKLAGDLSVGGALFSTYGKKIKPVHSKTGEHPSDFALRVVEEVEHFFEERAGSTRDFSPLITADLIGFKASDRIRGTQYEPGATRVAIESVATACKEANASCEKLKKIASEVHLSTEVEASVEEIIRLIKNNVTVTEKVMDMVVIEQVSLQAYVGFLASLTKDSGRVVETLVKEMGDSALGRNASKYLTAIQQAAKKVRY